MILDHSYWIKWLPLPLPLSIGCLRLRNNGLDYHQPMVGLRFRRDEDRRNRLCPSSSIDSASKFVHEFYETPSLYLYRPYRNVAYQVLPTVCTVLYPTPFPPYRDPGKYR
jgi:hypothetical protein